ncbi:MAG: hypothetical protein QXU46_06465 [Candidatus Bathyarchaeia archaeon]
MQVLALGCGGMGRVAIKDLVKYGEFDEVIIGDLDVEKAENSLKSCI